MYAWEDSRKHRNPPRRAINWCSAKGRQTSRRCAGRFRGRFHIFRGHGCGSGADRRPATAYRPASEKPLEIDAADGCGGVIKAAAHIGFLSHFLDEFGRDIESFRFAVHQHGDLVLGMEDLAVGTMTVGPATGAFTFDKGTGQHFAPSAEAADEPAAPFQVRLHGLFNMTRSIVSLEIGHFRILTRCYFSLDFLAYFL